MKSKSGARKGLRVKYGAAIRRRSQWVGFNLGRDR